MECILYYLLEAYMKFVWETPEEINMAQAQRLGKIRNVQPCFTAGEGVGEPGGDVVEVIAGHQILHGKLRELGQITLLDVGNGRPQGNDERNHSKSGQYHKEGNYIAKARCSGP